MREVQHYVVYGDEVFIIATQKIFSSQKFEKCDRKAIGDEKLSLALMENEERFEMLLRQLGTQLELHGMIHCRQAALNLTSYI